jgi:GIY-YIG catalytic domain
VTNLVNGKRYVGQTTRVKVRWRQHCQFGTTPLAYAIRKYGVDNFRFEIVLQVEDQQSANLVEARLIRKLGTMTPHGYNVCEGGGVGAWTRNAPRGDDHWTRRYPDRRLYGTKNGYHKLTPTQVRVIRFLYHTRNYAGLYWSQPRLARRYSVHQATISDIVRGNSWEMRIASGRGGGV